MAVEVTEDSVFFRTYSALQAGLRGAVVWAVLMGLLKLIADLRRDSRLLAWKARGQLGGICRRRE